MHALAANAAYQPPGMTRKYTAGFDEIYLVAGAPILTNPSILFDTGNVCDSFEMTIVMLALANKTLDQVSSGSIVRPK